MSGGGGEKVIGSVTPWQQVTPYLLGGKNVPGVLPEAASAYSSGNLAARPYFASTVAPMSAERNTALTGIANRAQAGSPLNAAAGSETMKTLGGGYLGQGNPYLSDIQHNGLREASRIAGMFGAGGRTGSGAMQDSIAAGYGAATAPYMFNAYENERNRMGNAAQFAPQLAAEDYRDLGAFQDVGAQRQQQSQAELTDQVQRWQQEQQRQAANLAAYQQLVTGTISPYNTQQQVTPGPGTGQTVLGGLLGGLGLAGQMGFQPFGSGGFFS